MEKIIGLSNSVWHIPDIAADYTVGGIDAYCLSDNRALLSVQRTDGSRRTIHIHDRRHFFHFLRNCRFPPV